MSHIRINPSDDLPIYRQIIRQVIDGIAAGRLGPGDKLPSHRDLSETLVISPLTVKKAYDQLEQQGHLETRRGQGTFVVHSTDVTSDRTRQEHLRSAVRSLAAEAYAADINTSTLIGMLREESRRIREGQIGRAALNKPSSGRHNHDN